MEKATVMETSNGRLSQKTYRSRDEDLSVCSYSRSDEAVKIGDHAVDGCTIVDEIDIFDARKYFNESSNIEAEKVSYNSRVSPVKNVNAMNLERNSERFDLSAAPSRFSSASSSVDGYINARNYMARAAATPTASSEASWNSKTGLLSNPPCAIPVSMRNAQKKTSSRWLFCRKCPCTGKKSVQVQEKAHLPAPTPTPSLSHKHCHSSSTTAMNPKRQTPHKTRSDNMWVNTPSFFPLQMQGQHSVVRASGKPFISTDHSANNFTFPILNPSSSSSSLKARLPARHESSSISTIQSISKSFPLATISNKSSIMIDDEVASDASDASSDLFEIESFSTTTTTKHRDSQDEIVNAKGFNNYFLYSTRREEPNEIAVAPTDVEWYEASEASIDWSVATAEGLSVAASELADDDTTIIRCNQKSSKQRSSSSSPNMNGLSLSSSCRCEKAVSVGPKPVKSLSSASNSKQRTQQQQG
ncbi:protein PHYTOCHROME KINASE SUBSTRATE 4 [Quercus suber]